jgi:hypothetical protein
MALPTSLTKKAYDLESDTDSDTFDFRKAQEDLKAALSARENRLFDPTLLAMAQGFLAPTKTGGFAESLGTAAGLAGQSLEREQKSGMENAQMRMQIAQMGMEQARKAKAGKMLGELLPSGAPASAPAGATTLAGAPEAGAPSGAPQQPPTSGRPVTGSDIAKLSMYDKEAADALEKGVKLDRDRYIISQNGIVFDRAAGRYVTDIPIPGQTQSDYSTPFGTFKMTPNEYAQLGDAISKGKGKEWIDMWRTGKIDVSGKPVAGAPVEGATPTGQTGRPTTSEAEAAAAAKKVEAEGTARTRVAQTTEVKEAAKAAIQMTPLYERAKQLLATKGIETYLGVLEKPDFLAQIGVIADEGIRVGPYAVTIPSVRKVVSQFTQDPAVISAVTQLGQIEALWQMASRKGLGSGNSISNMEQAMANATVPSFKDPKDAYVKKLEFLKEKADFDRELGRALKRTGMQYEDFEDTPEFGKMFDSYRTRLGNIGGVDPAKVQGASGATSGSAATDLRKRLRIQ